MATPGIAACTDEQFIEIWDQLGGVTAVSKHLRMSIRACASRRRSIEARHGIDLATKDQRNAMIAAQAVKAMTPKKPKKETPPPPLPPPAVAPKTRADFSPDEWRYEIAIQNGQVIIGSDCHYFPDIISTAHRAFVHVTKQIHPVAVILNGDILDGASISQHFRIRWHYQPTVKQEIEACQARLAEIEKVAANAKLIRTWGNHCSRFDTRLSQLAPQFEGLAGFTLKDHLPRWAPCMSVFINSDVVVKHRGKGGIHATRNNTLNSGRTIVTGHLHSQKITAVTDYNGTRYGVDAGTMADLDNPNFHYAEDDPRDWRSGFVVLTFVDGKLMPPDLCTVLSEGRVYFRGQDIAI